MGGRGASSGVRRITNSYEPGTVYKSTSKYSVEAIKDPAGTYYDEKRDRYSLVEKFAENPGFREIKRAPLGSMVVVHNPEMEFRLHGVIPAHSEYYEVVQRTKTIKALEYRGTTDRKGRYISDTGVRSETRSGWGVGEDLTKISDIQERFKYVDRVTIYKPK